MTLNFYTDMTKKDDTNEAQLLAELTEKGALVDSNAQVLPTILNEPNIPEPVNIESAGSWKTLIPKTELVEDTYKKIDKTVNDTSVNWLLALIAVLLLLILIFK